MRFRIEGTKVFVFFAALFFMVCFNANLFAQAGTSSITGTVTDVNGAAIPGATVTISDADTGFTRSVITGDDGKYSFPGIAPATYRLEVRASNFKKAVNTNAKALVETPLVLNIPLEPGDVSAVVDVTTNTIESVINTQDASLGNNFEPQQISGLPTDLRRVADLLTLQPGVTREGYVAGGRSDQANVLLDGVDINDQQNGGRTGQFQTSQDTVLRATAESVEEFRITTTNANANQGRSSGAQISLITKSGTNNFHGSGFYFYRPTAFSANSFFNNAAAAPRPSLARKVFGGSIGGPIIKDKLFFFYTYEGQRQTEGVSVVRTVPLAHLGQGELKFMGTVPGETLCAAEDPAPGCVQPHLVTLTSSDLNSIYSAVGLNPVAISVLKDAATKYAANDTTVGDGINTGGFRFNAPTTTAENTHIVRLDYKINDRQSVYFRGNKQFDVSTGTSQFPDTPATALWDHSWGFVVAHDWAISNDKVNNFRYGLTRQAFSSQGDSDQPSISFRFVFSPVAFARTLSRISPTQNITDDFTWIKGKHTFQFGGNIRIIRNERVDFGSAFDSAVTNPSFYEASGRVLDRTVASAGYGVPSSQRTIIQNAATALIGRFSQYSGNFTFDLDGSILDAGTPTERTFATEEYDTYFQDQWKPWRNLTLTLGMRYSMSRPVYEKKGFEVVTTQSLSDFFDQRKASAAKGIPFNGPITFEKGGPANNGPGFYKMDWNNWQPRVAAAWSPNFKSGVLKTLFGDNDESVIRGGFGITSDHFGGQLAVSFDGLSPIGFTSSTTISANTYNVTDSPAPLFTGFGQNIRALPGIPAPVQKFSTDIDPDCLAGIIQCPERIEASLDRAIKTPTHYTWNVSFGRKLPWGMYFEASYIGHKARHLLMARDVNALNDLVDPQSGMDWYTAAGQLHDLRAADTDINNIQPIPYFENLFPGLGGNYWGIDQWSATQAVYQIVARQDFTQPYGVCRDDDNNPVGCDFFDVLDWTFVQEQIDDLGVVPNMFFHPQYAAFSAFSSVGKSDYNGATFSLRQRLGETLTYDLNYTWSKSFDDASGLQTGDSFGSQFLLNPLRPQDNYSVSDFDTRHSINANFIFQLPFGKGKKWMSDANYLTDTFLSGWQLSGIFRYNSGLPIFSPFDSAQWATNWNAQSSGVRVQNIQIGTDRNTQNAFKDAQVAYNAWRNARPGETGDRNVLRLPGYSTMDMGLSKSFRMPWGEGHKLDFRWEVFNIFNLQYFNGDQFTRSTWGLQQDSDISAAPSDFGKIFTSIQGNPRRMQFGLRYSF